MKEIITGLLLASISLFSVSCSQEDTDVVKVAINTGPDQVIWDEVIRLAKLTEGLNVEVIAFNDYERPNKALENREVDVNVFQIYSLFTIRDKSPQLQISYCQQNVHFPVSRVFKENKRY